MRIAIVGVGRVGTTLGRAWAAKGHDIVYGVRDAAGAPPHERATIASVPAAAEAADVVTLAVPWEAAADAVAALGDLGGKPLVDVTNPIGPGFSLALGHTTSGAERLAALAKGARVVKAFNTTGLENMANPSYGDRHAFMPVAGDDPHAVASVAELASALGFDAVPLKGLARARELEPLALLWIKLALSWGHGRGIAFSLARGTPADPPRASATRVRRRIAIVGAGNIGGALARGWLRVGHDVRVVTRDPSAADAKALVALGATVSNAADGGNDREVVAFAVPAGAVVDVAKSMGGLAGKIVVDCTNAIAKGFTLQFGHTTSSTEGLAKALPDARFVRSFNQQGAEVLVHAAFGGLRATNFVASDDDEARHVVAALSDDLGLDTVEVGPLASARLLDPITLLWVALAQSIGTRNFGLSLVRR